MTEFLNLLRDKLTDHQTTFERTAADERMMHSCEKAAEMMVDAVRNHKNLLFCGNGGSAADAQHAAAELVGRYLKVRRAISAESLCVDPSILTAIGNDYGYDFIFSRQVEAKGKEGDVFFAISTSGKSSNILKALEVASQKGLKKILLTSERAPEDVRKLCDAVIAVPSKDTPRIQEVHVFVLHLLCEYIENKIS